jgi:hypothetical protein
MPGILKIILLAAGICAVYLALSGLTQVRREGSICEVPVVVEVLNGCGKSGVAENVAAHLRDLGFDVMYVGNADDFDYGETMVVDRTGDRTKARAVAGALGRATVVCQVSSTFFVDVTVVLGNDIATSSWLSRKGSKSL